MSADGSIRLHVENLGDPSEDDRSPIVLVHGFTQNARCWAPFDRVLADWGPVIAIDLPGHGRSAPATAGLWATGCAVAAAVTASAHVGYSLGARVLLHGALCSPGSVQRLVLIGAHPGIEDDAARRTRRAEDEQRAAHLERVGLAHFLDEWLALPLFAGLDDDSNHRRERLANDPGALADGLRHLSTGTQDPLWGRLDQLAMPVLVLAGEHDDRYREIGARTASAIGSNASFVVLPGVGHAAHLEDPETTGRIIVDWLTTTD